MKNTAPTGTLTTFQWVPPFAVTHVRELRVRWALEEAGRTYAVRAISFEDQASPAYRKLQPFGQVPCWDEEGLQLFESGAILLHLAQGSPALMPRDEAGRARTATWMFAALNSVEQHVGNYAELGFHKDAPWVALRKPALEAMVHKRMGDLETWLAGREYLEDQFTVADILMTTVLRLLDESKLLGAYPAVAAYKERCLARPAYQRALKDHLAHFAPQEK